LLVTFGFPRSPCNQRLLKKQLWINFLVAIDAVSAVVIPRDLPGNMRYEKMHLTPEPAPILKMFEVSEETNSINSLPMTREHWSLVLQIPIRNGSDNSGKKMV